MEQQGFNSLLQKYLEGRATAAEQKVVEQWYENIHSNDTSGLTSAELSQIQNRIWKNVQGQANISPVVRKINWIKVAASLLILIASSFLFRMSNIVTESTTSGTNSSESKEFVSHVNSDKIDHSIGLPDGSTVVIKPGSEIKYPHLFGAERHVMLRGMAFFDVIRDPERPFIVHAKDVATRVLGTSFWVQENPLTKTVEVSVKSGKVMVYAQQDERHNKLPETLILKPNQKGVYDERKETLVKKLVEDPVVVDRSVALKLKYENAPVPEIFNALQRMYGIRIKYNSKDLANCSLTTELIEENLFERIQIICDALGLEYVIGKEAIEISGKCK